MACLAIRMIAVLVTAAVTSSALPTSQLPRLPGGQLSRLSLAGEVEAQEIASLLRPVDPSEPDALLKFVVSELERSKREAGTLGPCEGIEVARIVSRPHEVENGMRYAIELKVKPVHIVTDKCNNNAVKDIIPSTLEECQLEVRINRSVFCRLKIV